MSAPVPGGEAASQLLVIVPKGWGSEQVSVARCFADVANCRLIVDRRDGERRQQDADFPGEERRRGERRSSQLEATRGFVVLIH
jgi:hypothetical protein